MKKIVVLTVFLVSLLALVGCSGNIETEIQVDEDKIQKEFEISNDFALDNENKYLLITDMKWRTMQNDGGSHSDVYYQIDLNTDVVKKCQDSYVGFQGYEYEGKVINKKILEEAEKNTLEGILESLITNVQEEQNLGYQYYELSIYSGDAIKIYNKDTINALVEVLE